MKKESKLLLRKREEYLNKRFLSKQGCWFTVIGYWGTFDVDVQFDDGHKVFKLACSNVRKGSVKNPYHPSVEGVGFEGEGKYTTENNIKIATNWRSVLRRCYSPLQQKLIPTYIGCTVDKRWHNFQNFAAWYEEFYKEGFELDKDILIKGNKIYSPETCLFVPPKVNAMFTKSDATRGEYPIGVSFHKATQKFRVNGKIYGNKLFATVNEGFLFYKKDKEQQLKNAAEEYKDVLTEAGYNAVRNWVVEETD